MMKTTINRFLVANFVCFFLLPVGLMAQNWEVKGRVAYFHPFSRNVRDIYSSGWPEYQLELSYRFCDPCGLSPWSLWTNVGYFSKEGHSIRLEDDTRIQFWPVGVGLKYTWEFPCNIETYLGAGITYSFLRIKDESPFVENRIRKSNFGGIIKTGIGYRFCECILLEIFADYSYTKFQFSGRKNCVERNDLDMSGLLLGVGLGFSF